jgi:hypothetical protein
VASALGLMLAFAGGLFEVAVAAQGPGLLPEAVAERLRAGVCDVLEADSQVDCARPGACRFRRSDGTPFAPHAPDWWDVHALPHAVAVLALGPAAALLGADEAAAKKDAGDGPSGWEGRLGALSGAAWRLDDGGAVFRLSPGAASWAVAQLPDAKTPMCGVTAGEVHRAAFRPMLRRLATTWSRLQRAGGALALDEDALGRALADPAHPLTRRCEAVARAVAGTRCEDGGTCTGADGRSDTERSARRSCRWWLRRHAHPAVPARTPQRRDDSLVMRRLLAAVLARYDSDWLKTRGASLQAVD